MAHKFGVCMAACLRTYTYPVMYLCCNGDLYKLQAFKNESEDLRVQIEVKLLGFLVINSNTNLLTSPSTK